MIRGIRHHIRRLHQRTRPVPMSVLFSRFQDILQLNNRILELMADMNDKSGADYVFDIQYIRSACGEMTGLVKQLIDSFNRFANGRYHALWKPFERISDEIESELAGRRNIPDAPLVMPYKEITVAFADMVGGKNANLAELKNQLGLPVPEGFAVTLAAFYKILEENALADRIADIARKWSAGVLPLQTASNQIQVMVLEAKIPGSVRKAIRDAQGRIQKDAGGERLLWSVRSSATGEDGEHSFAGQFLTRLNIRSEEIVSAYQEVLASTYSASAMAYRRQKGIDEAEAAMAVGFQPMVTARKSGVLFTLDAAAPETDAMVLSATWGMGEPIVSGEAQADQYRLERSAPYRVLKTDISLKNRQLMARPEGGSVHEPVDAERQTRACLTDGEIRRIADIGMTIEKYFRSPQDIEWSIDIDGNLFVLQARPLNIRVQLRDMVCDMPAMLKGFPVIFAGKGVIAQSGIISGPVRVVRNDEDLVDFPPGAILVARQSSPKFAAVAGRVNGIITDIGSPTGHMANIAREFRIPTILDTGVATKLLANGREITMDAGENVVYEGIIKALCYYEFSEPGFEESYEYRLLRRMLKKIAPLALTDPNDKQFTPRGCRTYHDITRFIHEKAVEALIESNQTSGLQSPDASMRRLKSEIPIDLSILDIGGGVANGTGKKRVLPADGIGSVPMRAFLEGLELGDLWETHPMPVDFRGFMSSLTRTFSPQLATPRFIGRNLAVISKEYANISLRLGYHFSLIDAYVCERINDNYVYFRFMGGVTEPVRRNRRARLIALILEQNDFKVRLRQDLVVARIKKFDMDRMIRTVRLLGQLVAFTRQLDVRMDSDDQIDCYLKKFTDINNDRETVKTPGEDQNGRSGKNIDFSPGR